MGIRPQAPPPTICNKHVAPFSFQSFPFESFAGSNFRVIRVIRGPSLTVAVQKTVAARAAGEYDAMRRTMMAGDFVTIATFTTLPEAEAARLRIETEGI